ncbi:MAG: hypothetical protein ACOCY6_06085, partial [Halodesulfurarchaeum sp.]
MTGTTPPLFCFVLQASITNQIVEFGSQILGGMIGLINGLIQFGFRSYLIIDPKILELGGLEALYQLLMVVFFMIVGLYGIAIMGWWQVFPDDEDGDPFRFGRRALAATLSLFIVNPPVETGTAFDLGAIGWTIIATNAIIGLFTDHIGVGVDLVDGALLESATVEIGGLFAQMVFGAIIVAPVSLAVGLLFFGLVLRQVLVVIAFGLYPLLIAFWVADAGPLKYGKKTAETLLHSMVKTLVGGILIAAFLGVGLTIAYNTSEIFANGSDSYGPHLALISIFMRLFVLFVTMTVPLLMLKGMLGKLGSSATKALGLAATGGVTLVVTAGAVVVTLPAGGSGGLLTGAGGLLAGSGIGAAGAGGSAATGAASGTAGAAAGAAGSAAGAAGSAAGAAGSAGAAGGAGAAGSAG